MKPFTLFLFLIVATITATAQIPISGPTDYTPQAFDVLHYDALLDLRQAPLKTMTGVCTITLRWVSDPAGGPFYFHLRDLRVDSVWYNGTPTTATAEGTPAMSTYHYRVNPPPAARAGDTALIRIAYSGTMGSEPGANSWGGVFGPASGPLYAMGVGFYANYVSTTQHWLPCYDHPSDKATFRGRFLVKKGMAVASNGQVTVQPQPGDTTVIYNWLESKPCATYLLTFAVDAYLPLQIAGGDSLPIVVYAKAGDTANTHYSFKLLPRMVSTFSKLFGAYPFEKVGYVNTPTGAMEHQTMISINTALSVRRDTVYSTAAHELAHQWFGDMVTPTDYRHAWLTESFATYCEAQWAQELFGFGSYLTSQGQNAGQYIGNTSRGEGIFPLYDFKRTSPASNYPGTIYNKGSAVVGMLRYHLGDSVFYDALRAHLARYAYGNATTEDLRSSLESRAGYSLKWFFDQWVYGKGWPKLSLQVTPQKLGGGYNRVQVTITQTQPDSFGVYTNLPVEIGFVNGSNTTYRMINLALKQESFTLDSVPSYTSVTVNTGPSVRALLQVASLSGVDFSAIVPDSNTAEFHLKPNPTSGARTLTVEVKNVRDCSDIRYQFYNVSGRRVLEGVNNACTFAIPLDGLPAGAYIVRFKYQNTLYDLPVAITR